MNKIILDNTIPVVLKENKNTPRHAMCFYFILILQSEKNHDSVERLNLADRITEVEKANNLYLDLDTQRGIVKEQKGLSMRIRKNVK